MTRTRWNSSLVATMAALATMAGLGCSSDGPHVVVIGDSITGLVADDYASSDAGDYRYTLRATNGATATEMLEDARDIADDDFEQAVINLGTNDGVQGVPIAQTQAAFDELLRLFDEATCIHLTTLNEGAQAIGDPGVADRMAEINAHIRALADAHANVDLIDWNAALRASEGDGELLVDAVHPNDAGQQLLLEMSVEALEDCG